MFDVFDSLMSIPEFQFVSGKGRTEAKAMNS